MSDIAVHMIVAAAQNGVIGRDGDMPWRLSTDLKRFKAITMGKPVIMGRKTWASLGRPLPGRSNIVVTRDHTFDPDGAVVTHSLENALKIGREEAQKVGEDALFIIGGGEIFKQALPLAQKIYLTRILASIEGDTFFPPLASDEWQEMLSEDVAAGEKDNYPTRFAIYQRRN